MWQVWEQLRGGSGVECDQIYKTFKELIKIFIQKWSIERSLLVGSETKVKELGDH